MKRSESEVALRKEFRRLARHLRALAREDRRMQRESKHVHIAMLYRGIAEGTLQAATFIGQSLRWAGEVPYRTAGRRP